MGWDADWQLLGERMRKRTFYVGHQGPMLFVRSRL
jgi:hypothetical protein